MGFCKTAGGRYTISETVTISISKELAFMIESCENLCFNGQNIIIKSIKVVE